MKISPKVVKSLMGVGGLLSFTGFVIDLLFRDAAQEVAINDILDARLAALDEEDDDDVEQLQKGNAEMCSLNIFRKNVPI